MAKPKIRLNPALAESSLAGSTLEQMDAKEIAVELDAFVQVVEVDGVVVLWQLLNTDEDGEFSKNSVISTMTIGGTPAANRRVMTLWYKYPGPKDNKHSLKDIRDGFITWLRKA
jgi:hypothetical protein